jgi:hypothetical protein
VDSKFARAYAGGLHKTKYWDPVYEDSMDLIAKLPEIAAMVSDLVIPELREGLSLLDKPR